MPPPKTTESRKMTLSVSLAGQTKEEEAPQVAVYLLSAEKKVEKKLAVARDGKLALDLGLSGSSRTIIAFGPDADDIKEINPKNLIQFVAEDQWPTWSKAKTIEFPESIWKRWLVIRVCVSGRVRKCWPPYFWRCWHHHPHHHPFPHLHPHCFPPFPLFPRRCAPICNGVVEIYERECCRKPFLLPDIPLIISRLREIIPPEYYHKTPVIPLPPPSPELKAASVPVREIASDRAIVRNLKLADAMEAVPQMDEEPEHLVQDLAALEKLPQADAVTYVQKRPHLWHFWCTCHVRKVGEAVLSPDGHFTFCYDHVHSIFNRNCWTSYYFKVKQWQENQWVEIYNGSRCHRHYAAGQFANIVTWRGRACSDEGPGIVHDKPFAMLQDIGSTPSWNLVSHWNGKDAAHKDLTQVTDTSLSAVPANGGLVFPPAAGSPVPATVDYLPDNTTLNSWLVNRPWGEVLSFRMYFDPALNGAGACYYRMSIVPAEPSGAPVAGATPIILTTPISWNRFQKVGDHTEINGLGLGPDPAKAPGLYRIPYRPGIGVDTTCGIVGDWLEGQYHQRWDTRDYTGGQWLLSIEIFDKNGAPLSKTKFDYLRWLESTGPGSASVVPFQKLVHLFWTDNRTCFADIEDLRKNGTASIAECQFMSGPGATTTFSAGFRAFHTTVNPVPPSRPETFMWYYRLWSHRGLNGPDLAFQTGCINTPATLDTGSDAESVTKTFADMLGVLPKCSFALNLWVYARHTNGSRRLNEYDMYDQAAFALENTTPVMIFKPPIITDKGQPDLIIK